MASSEKIHYSVFPIVGTVNERGVILHVEEKYFLSATALVAGTTLSDFMSTEDVPKGDAITAGFGSYIYREQLEKQGNRLRFVFLAPKTEDQQIQVVKPEFPINEVTFWPDWLLSLYALEAVIETQNETGAVATNKTSNKITSQRFLDRYSLIKGGDYNTVHLVEEFFSPTPITSLFATEPRPMPVFYNLFGLRNSFDCIHAGVTIPEPYISAIRVPDFGTPNAQEVVWQEGSFFPPTNHTAWIPHYRKLIVTERDGGYHYRRHKVIPPQLNQAIQI